MSVCRVSILAPVFAALALSACAGDQTSTNVESFVSGLEATALHTPLVVPLTIGMEDAVALAIERSSAVKAKQLEALLAQQTAEHFSVEMLPSFTASGDFYARDSKALSHSSLSSTYSTSSEERMISGDLKVGWNVLDFGLSYLRARQSREKSMAVNEDARRIAFRTAADARLAFWNSLALRQLRAGMTALAPQTKKTLKRLDAGLADAAVDHGGLLQDKRELVAAMTDADAMLSRLSPAELELCSLIACPSMQDMNLEVPASEFGTETGDAGTEIAEALRNRPELRSLFHEAEINEAQARSAVLQLLPSLGSAAALNGDSNMYLFNANWLSLAANASLNLLKLARLPQQGKINATQRQVHREQAIAAAHGVALQVLLARQRIVLAERTLAAAEAQLSLERQQMEQTKREVSVGAARANSLTALQYRHLAAEVRCTLARGDLVQAIATHTDSLGRDSSTSHKHRPLR